MNNGNFAKVLQYANSALLTLICAFSIFIYTHVTDIKKLQEEQGKELIRIKTIQDINSANIGTLNVRVTAVELNTINIIKTWTEENYVRKPQK